MAFMMPVMKNNYDIYKDSRSRKTSECSTASSSGGPPTISSVVGVPQRQRKVSECKSESFSTSPSHTYRMQLQRCQSSRAFPRNSSRTSHSSMSGALSPTRSYSQSSSPPKTSSTASGLTTRNATRKTSATTDTNTNSNAENSSDITQCLQCEGLKNNCHVDTKAAENNNKYNNIKNNNNRYSNSNNNKISINAHMHKNCRMQLSLQEQQNEIIDSHNRNAKNVVSEQTVEKINTKITTRRTTSKKQKNKKKRRNKNKTENFHEVNATTVHVLAVTATATTTKLLRHTRNMLATTNIMGERFDMLLTASSSVDLQPSHKQLTTTRTRYTKTTEHSRDSSLTRLLSSTSNTDCTETDLSMSLGSGCTKIKPKKTFFGRLSRHLTRSG